MVRTKKLTYYDALDENHKASELDKYLFETYADIYTSPLKLNFSSDCTSKEMAMLGKTCGEIITKIKELKVPFK